TRYFYDARDRMYEVRDPLANSTTYEFDVLDRRILETDAADSQHSFVYDLVDNVLSETDKNGRTTSYTRNLRDFLLKEEWIEGGGTVAAIAYTRDGRGRVTTAVGNGSSLVFAYDSIGRLRSASTTIDAGGPQVTFRYSWDTLSNPVEVTEFVGSVETARTAY